jgi:predicted ATPase
MRVKKLQLKEFKRFDDLTIDLGENPQKIVAMVGPNGCGKSSIFDAFEEKLKDFRNWGGEEPFFFYKAFFYVDELQRKTTYNKHNSINIIVDDGPIKRNSFYIRTSYRFTAKLNINTIEAMPSILEFRDEPISSIALDTRLESNYKRMMGNAYSDFFAGSKTGSQVREELIEKINKILKNILDIEISDLGNVFNKKGQFYFKKGNVKDFPYANLSSGEKEIVDIILDLFVKIPEYNNTVFCIDEPELHINTAIQRKLLIEIDKLIPDNCQLWVATHSIGFLRAMQEELNAKSQILDFSEKDYFTGSQIIIPITSNRTNWKRIFNTALEDLSDLISPKRIIYCEGKDTPGANGQERGLDAQVYNNIFSVKYNDTIFVSSGGNTELDQRSDIAIKILTKVFNDLEILVLKDRDISSGKINNENDRQMYLQNNPGYHRILKRFEIENYLYDKEILKRYCETNHLHFDETDYDNFVTDIINQNLKDQTNRIKNICNIITSMNSEIFKQNLSNFIIEDTDVFKELEGCIFNRL